MYTKEKIRNGSEMLLTVIATAFLLLIILFMLRIDFIISKDTIQVL